MWHTEHDPTRSGQAMIELMVALVALLTLTGGLLLIVSFGTARTEAMMKAREKAGRKALEPMPAVTSPDFIQDWDAGHDGKDLTVDDEMRRGNHVPFANLIVEQAGADATQWDVLSSIDDHALPGLRGHAAPVSVFGLVKGEEHRSVDLLSAVQHLFYDGDRIDIDAEVWLTHTRGIY